jgi:hypothetical protein
MKKHNLISPGLLLSFAIAFLFMAAPAQAGSYLHLGYGHHGGYHGYGHSYGHGYSHSYYGLHNYYGYGHHGYGHLGHGSYGYGNHYSGFGYATPYSAYNDYSSSSSYRNRTYDRSSSGNGWTLLGNNQASAALTDFGRQAQASPSKGDPKVGYALASADLGRLDKGVWAMRRALRTDPNALHYVSLNPPLDAKVGQIIRQYEKKLAYSSRDGDAAFMLASLHYLRRNIEAARTNINQAMLARHVSTSTRNLKDLIDQEKQG